MEHNSNGKAHPVGSFEWLFTQRLRSYAASGASPDDVATIQARGSAMVDVLSEFRQKRRQAGDSGKYTREGLRDLLFELAAQAAGKIRHDNDFSILEKRIAQVEGKLSTPAAGEKAEDRLISFWKQMELRAIYERMGLTIYDQATGSLTFDRLKADNLYRQAAERGDDTAMLALEGWPNGSPVSPDLIAEGQQQRMLARDPVLAQELTELRIFREMWDQTVRDALAELREHLPPDDVIAEQAAG